MGGGRDCGLFDTYEEALDCIEKLIRCGDVDFSKERANVNKVTVEHDDENPRDCDIVDCEQLWTKEGD